MPQLAPPTAGRPNPQMAQAGGGGAPMGSTPATTPTANRGGEAAAMQVIGNVVQLLTHALQQAGATSEIGQKILDLLNKASKIAPPGTSSPAGQKNVMDQAQMRNAQQNQMAQAMRQRMMQAAQGGGGGGGGAGGAPPGMAA